MTATDGICLPKMKVRRAAPANVILSDEQLFLHEYEKEIDACASELLKGVKILPNGYLVRSFVPLAQSFAVQKTGLSKTKRIAHSLVSSAYSSAQFRTQRALFATDEFSNGFFHWFCDVLPRLEALEQSAPAFLRQLTIVVPAMAAYSYVPPSLDTYSLGGVHILKNHVHALCDEILVVPAVAPTGNYRPELMVAIRKRFRQFFASGSGNERVYVSRAQAPLRRVANEGDILPVLKRHEIMPLLAETLRFEDQVKRIGSASVLVGGHGAGLTHMLWMNPGSTVVELRRRGDRWNNCYFSLASALGHKYFYLLCEGKNSRGDMHSTDIVVNPAELDRVLDSAVEIAESA